MASCKECYHYEVCRMHYQQKCELTYECDRQYRITEKRFASLIQIFDYKEKAVDRYNRKFLTKEEAEKAIKERENNAN